MSPIRFEYCVALEMMLGERVRGLCSHNRCAGFAQRSDRVAWPVSLDENARKRHGDRT